MSPCAPASLRTQDGRSHPHGIIRGLVLPACSNFGFFFCTQGKKGEAGPPGTPGLLGPQVTTISARPSLAALPPRWKERSGRRSLVGNRSCVVSSSERMFRGSCVLLSVLAPTASHSYARRKATMWTSVCWRSGGGHIMGTHLSVLRKGSGEAWGVLLRTGSPAVNSVRLAEAGRRTLLAGAQLCRDSRSGTQPAQEGTGPCVARASCTKHCGFRFGRGLAKGPNQAKGLPILGDSTPPFWCLTSTLCH